MLSLTVFWMLLDGTIGVIKILTQLPLHCWPCLQVRMLYLSLNAITAAIFSYPISSSACFSCWQTLATVNTEKCLSWASSFLHSSSHLFQNNFCRRWKEWLSGWRVGGQVDAALITSEECIYCCYLVVFYALQAVFKISQVWALVSLWCVNVKNIAVNNVNHISDETVHLFKMLLLAEHASAFCFCGQLSVLLRNCALTGVSSFQCCNLITFTGKGWRATKKINWKHAIVRTGAWARAE